MHYFTLWNVERHLPFLWPVLQSMRWFRSACKILVSSSLLAFPNSLVSSANFRMELNRLLSMSLINIKNNTGPNTDPWGTPLVAASHDEQNPSIHTRCCLLLNHSLIQSHTFPQMPCLANLSSRWGTLSKFICAVFNAVMLPYSSGCIVVCSQHW